MVGGPRRHGRERGAVLVEAALAFPILVLIIFGSIEAGIAWEAKSATTSGVRTALLRTASLGNQPEADLRTLQSIVGEIGPDNVASIDWIVVFNADTDDIDARIQQCAANAGAGAGNGVAELCTAYDAADVQAVVNGTLDIDRFDDGTNADGDGYTCDSSKIDRRFCAGGRLTNGAINVGVAIQYVHEWTTGILPSQGLVYTEYAVSSTLKGEQAAPPVVSSSRARIVMGGGAARVDAPTSTAEGGRESDADASVWAESGPFTLTTDIVVNAATSGTHTGRTNQRAVIPAGTKVCSYYVQIDRESNGRSSGSLEVPDAEILGVIYQQSSLRSSDDALGGADTEYSGRRGLERNDYVTLDLETGRVDWDVYVAANRYTDDLRILTSCD